MHMMRVIEYKHVAHINQTHPCPTDVTSNRMPSPYPVPRGEVSSLVVSQTILRLSSRTGEICAAIFCH